jgi:NDP-sugar pyrophosphorylase family protein
MTADQSAPALGVIMAGGRGARMRASGAHEPKPLVGVLGAPLVERNVTALIRHEILDVRVVLASGGRGAAVLDWCEERGAALMRAAGGRLTVVEEGEPLGNCGGLALAAGSEAGDAVLLFADNLTDLDLTAVVEAHRERGAALTLAVHDEPFRLPYGVVDASDGRVSGYREKPTLAVSVGSGVAVVSADARALLSGPAGLSDFANACVGADLVVAAWPHSARWIDVNDVARVEAAEAMVRGAPASFELFWPAAAVSSAVSGIPDPADPTDAADQLPELDDLDPDGRPVRISAAAPADGLSSAARRRVRAWQRQAPPPAADSPSPAGL